jgi:uncharacterized membrane protein
MEFGICDGKSKMFHFALVIREEWAMKVLACTLIVLFAVGCSKPDVKPIVQPPPTPTVTPDLKPTADALVAQSTDLRGKLEAAKNTLATEAKKLEVLAVKNQADVTAQRQAVDAALAQYSKIAADYLACQQEQNATISQLQKQLESLSGEAASAKKYQTVLQVSGMVFFVVLLGVVLFAPLPAFVSPFKWFIVVGLAVAALVTFLGIILSAYAKQLVILSLVGLGLGIVAVVLWAILSGKFKLWTQQIGMAVKMSPDAVPIATQVQGYGTNGLGAVLDEVGAKVDLTAPK